MRWWALAGGRSVRSRWSPGLGLALPTDLPPLRPDELASIGSLGPWPPPAARDASNRVSGRAEAAALGEALFHTTRLSTVGGLRCASCHAPWRRFTDGRARALGAEAGARNTPSLLNVRLQHWFGWDGANDSLWSQSIRPMLDAREMRADAAHVARALRDDEALKRLYALAFGHAPPADDERALVDAGKALAAYQETLASEPHAVRCLPRCARARRRRCSGALPGRRAARPEAVHRARPVHRMPCGPELQRRRVPPLAHRFEAARRRLRRRPRARPREAAGQRVRAQRPLRRRDQRRTETRIAAARKPAPSARRACARSARLRPTCTTAASPTCAMRCSRMPRSKAGPHAGADAGRAA